MSTPSEGESLRTSEASASGEKSWLKKNSKWVYAGLVVLVLLLIGYYVMYHTELLNGWMGEEKSEEGLGRGVVPLSA